MEGRGGKVKKNDGREKVRKVNDNNVFRVIFLRPGTN